MGGVDRDPESALIGAVNWLRAVLLGSTGTTVAVIAVATVGLLMLSGRVPLRRGTTVIIGCFILFSAANIADGIVSTTSNFGGQVVALPPPSPRPYTPTIPSANPFDPYASASVPAQPGQPIIR